MNWPCYCREEVNIYGATRLGLRVITVRNVSFFSKSLSKTLYRNGKGRLEGNDYKDDMIMSKAKSELALLCYMYLWPYCQLT